MASDSTSANSAPEDTRSGKEQANPPQPPPEASKPSESLPEAEKVDRTIQPEEDFDTTVAGDTTLQDVSLHVKSSSADSSSPRILNITQEIFHKDTTASADPLWQQQITSDLQQQRTSGGSNPNADAGDITQDVTIIVEERAEETDTAKRPSSEDNNSSGAKAPSVAARSLQPRPINLQLNIEPLPSTRQQQPWDLVSPAEDRDDNNDRSAMARLAGISMSASGGAYSSGPRDFGVMQSAAGNGRPLVPKSSYYFGPPAPGSAYGTPPVGQIGVHHPREILRIERDYTGGEVIQFAPIYPLELEGRLTPTQFLETINDINEILISAHSLRYAFWDHLITVFTLQLSRALLSTHFEKEMKRLRNAIDDLNLRLFNPVGLNVLWPGDVAFLFLEIEYY